MRHKQTSETRHRRRLLPILMAIMLVIGTFPVSAADEVQIGSEGVHDETSTPGSLDEGEVWIDKDVTTRGAGVFEITLQASGKKYSETEEIVENIDVVLVLDRSTSMDDNDKLDNMKEAAKDAVDAIIGDGNNGNRIAVVKFGSNAEEVLGFNEDASDIKDAIDDISIGWLTQYTNIQQAFEITHDLINDSAVNKPVIVLITDGAPTRYRASTDSGSYQTDYPTTQDAIDWTVAQAMFARTDLEASSAPLDEVEIYTIGIDVSGDPDVEDTLAPSSPNRYWDDSTLTGTSVGDIYDAIIDNITEEVFEFDPLESGSSIVVTDTIGAGFVAVEPLPAGLATSGDAVVWTIDGDWFNDHAMDYDAGGFEVTTEVSFEVELSAPLEEGTFNTNVTESSMAVFESVESGQVTRYFPNYGWVELVGVTSPPETTAGIEVRKCVSIDGGETWDAADTASGPAIYVGETVRFYFRVRNTSTGGETLYNVELTDDVFGVLIDIEDGVELAPGESIEAWATTTAALGQHVNTATAEALAEQEEFVSDSNMGHYFGLERPQEPMADIDVEKLVSVDGGETWQDADTSSGPAVMVGEEVQFRFIVENTSIGDVMLYNVQLTDDVFGLLLEGVALEPGATTEAMVTVAAVEGQHENTATAAAMTGQEEPVSDSDMGHYFGYLEEMPDEHEVTVTDSPGGTASWTGDGSYTDGYVVYLTFDADSGRYIDDVTLNGDSIGSVSSYTIDGITTDAAFVVITRASGGGGGGGSRTDYYDITITASPEGTASGTGAGNHIREHSSRDLTFTADSGFDIVDVTMDGESLGAIESYSIDNLTEDLDFVIYTVEENVEIGEELSPEAPPEPEPGPDPEPAPEPEAEPEAEVILDMEPIPEAMPATGGLPFAAHGILGASLTGLGLIFKHKKR